MILVTLATIIVTALLASVLVFNDLAVIEVIVWPTCVWLLSAAWFVVGRTHEIKRDN